MIEQFQEHEHHAVHYMAEHRDWIPVRHRDNPRQKGGFVWNLRCDCGWRINQVPNETLARIQGDHHEGKL